MARSDRDDLLGQQRQRQLALERLQDQHSSIALEEKKLQDAVKALTIAHQHWKQQQQELQDRRTKLEMQLKELQR